MRTKHYLSILQTSSFYYIRWKKCTLQIISCVSQEAITFQKYSAILLRIGSSELKYLSSAFLKNPSCLQKSFPTYFRKVEGSPETYQRFLNENRRKLDLVPYYMQLRRCTSYILNQHLRWQGTLKHVPNFCNNMQEFCTRLSEVPW